MPAPGVSASRKASEEKVRFGEAKEEEGEGEEEL